MKSWEEFYSRPLTIKDYIYALHRHQFLFSEILRTGPKRIVEVGIGSGAMSIFLSHFDIEVYGIDNNIKILKIARRNAKRFNTTVKFILADGLKPLPLKGVFDVAFSEGVIEHFTDGQIKKFIKNQLDISKKVLISVPNKYYWHPTQFSNDRYLGIKEWKEILRPFNISKICYYGVELVSLPFIIRKVLTLRPHHIIKPHRIFIEIRE